MHPTASSLDHGISDADGNRTQQETPAGDLTTLTWDSQNRNIAVELPSLTIVSSVFNSDHNKVQRDDGTDVTNFLWDFKDLILETDDLGATLRRLTYKHPGPPNKRDSKEQQPNEFGKLISQEITSETDTFFHHYDALGSTAALTDSSEVVTDEYSYEASGETATKSGATPNPYQWVAQVGYRKDEETELYDLRRRNYDATTGGFLSEDPVRNDEENLYRYASNQPTQRTDPSGLEPPPSPLFLQSAESDHVDSDGVSAIATSYNQRQLQLEQLIFVYRMMSFVDQLFPENSWNVTPEYGPKQDPKTPDDTLISSAITSVNWFLINLEADHPLIYFGNTDANVPSPALAALSLPATFGAIFWSRDEVEEFSRLMGTRLFLLEQETLARMDFVASGGSSFEPLDSLEGVYATIAETTTKLKSFLSTMYSKYHERVEREQEAKEALRKEIEKLYEEQARQERELIKAIEKYTERFGISIGETSTDPSSLLKGVFQEARNRWNQPGGWDYEAAHAPGAIDTFAIFPGEVDGHEYMFLARKHDPSWPYETEYSLLGVYESFEQGQQAMLAFKNLREAEIENAEARMMDLRLAGYSAILAGPLVGSAIRSGGVLRTVDAALAIDQTILHSRQAYTGEQQRLLSSSAIGKLGLAIGVLNRENERAVGDFIANYGTLTWAGARMVGATARRAGRRNFTRSVDEFAEDFVAPTTVTSQVNPRLTQRLEAFRAYRANGGTMDMARWVKATQGNTAYGTGFKSGFADWSRRVGQPVHGNSLAATGPHDVYVLRDASTRELLHFGETGRGYLTRLAEHQRDYAKLGIRLKVDLLHTVEGKAAARALESRYIDTYIRVFGQRPPFNPVNH
jgi:RHS repeat-associated protein